MHPDTDDAVDRLEDARHVLHGSRGDSARKDVAYAAYVTLIVVGLYGFPVLRALLVAGDRAGMAAGLTSPWAMLIGALVVAALVLVAREAGRVRGPVVAPVPWVDLVVSSSVSRWAALRPWFGYSLFAVLFAGGLAGLLVGTSLWGAQVSGAWVVPVAVVGGLIVGLLAGAAWLLGQSRLSPPLPPTMPRVDEATPSRGLIHTRREVERLGLTELRTQAARSGRILGGVQAGDLRAVRLEAARPITRARSARLRHRGPVATIVARDLLGLRRTPTSGVVGVLLTAAAAGALGATLGSSAVPPMVGLLAGAVSFAGFSALSEGLRLEADTMGTPALFGLPPVRAALAHLVVPAANHLVVTAVVGTLSGRAAGAGLPDVLPWLVISSLLLCGSTLLAAYRGRPPTSQFSPVPSPQTVLMWYSFPALLSTLLIGGIVWGATHFPTSGMFVIATWVAPVWLLYVGLNRVQKENLAHRDV
ncbi:hypothetical protein [Knoellia subterranea]|uniref:Uncharacterized protein n=1 Tax=Knoellia subterranea KCTC 19937 TaxID=1385521 RepID=A0A0A0JNH9_9MICO|nr:hypothetical protein [Knoellia subterranea]KGN38319.1 hypothetical protein N803_09705 [Knoellia subterranea KCTC 19937]